MSNEDIPIQHDSANIAWRDPQQIVIATVVPELTPPASTPPVRKRRWKLPLALFVLTCLSTFVTGALDGSFAWRNFNLMNGLAYAGSLMTILVCHEMGHFLQARRYGVPASYPFFLPMPFSPFGTLGAVIAMDSRIRDRKALFDIGVSGPLAGLVPALIFCAVGLHYSRPISQAEVAIATLASQEPGWALGASPLFRAMIDWLRPVPMGYMIDLHPMATAGWVGLLITALNLFPIGQLDGGHVLYAMVRRGQHVIAHVVLMVAIAMIILSPERYLGWMIMVMLLVLVGPKHPPTWDDRTPVGWKRTVIGWLTLAFLLVGFTPQPLVTFEVRQPPERQPQQIEVRLDRQSQDGLPAVLPAEDA